MKVKHISIGFITAALSAPLIAEEQSAVELYLGAAHYFWDGDRDIDDSTSLELGAEVPVSEELSFEAWVSDFDADMEPTNAELDGRRYAAGALYHLSDGSYRPFLSAGVAHQEFSADNASDIDETLLYVGAGAKKYFDNNLMLRGEVLAMNSLDHEMTDLGLRVSLGYAFGRDGSPSTNNQNNTSVAEPAPAAKETQESNASSAPETAEEAAPLEEKAAAPVAAAGASQAELDSDGDGVVDSKDQCKNTDAAFKVDENGCPQKLVKTLSIDLHIKFKTNSAEFSDDTGEVKELADFLNTHTHTKLVIEGHTDSSGSAAYNKNLSQDRADSIKAMLVESYGIDASRVDAIGYGEEQPLVSNDTAEGRAKNRRVIGKVSSDVEEEVRK